VEILKYPAPAGEGGNCIILNWLDSLGSEGDPIFMVQLLAAVILAAAGGGFCVVF
jgi:hypothetical protein